MAGPGLRPSTGKLEEPAEYIALNCPLKPCKGEGCRNWKCCVARQDGRDVLKTEQAKVA